MTAKESTPVVSIGVPVYNGEKYLKECLNSIAGQTYEDWECVIIDNFSTDRTNEIARSFVEADSRFKIYRTDKLLSIFENWNYCYSKTNHDSPYFKIIPADDWIFPEFLSSMLKVLEENPEAGFCSSYIIDDKKTSCDGLDILDGSIFPGRDMLYRHLKGELLVFGSANAVLYRTDVLKQLDYYPVIFREDSFHMDTFLCYELLYRSDLAFVFQVLSYTRRHNETVTSNVANVINTGLFFIEKSLHDFKHINPELEIIYKQVRLRYAFSLLRNRLKGYRKMLKWHRDNLKRPISNGEYLQSIFKWLFNKL